MNLILLSFLISTSAFADSCPTPVLPNEFELSEQFISLTTKMNIESDDGKHGYVREKLISLSTSFEYFNEQGLLVAKASKVIFALGGRVAIFDCNGAKIGEIKEEIFKSLFRFSTVYTIYGANDEEIGTSEKFEVTSTNFEIKNKNGEVIAKVSRPWFSFINDNWSVRVIKPGMDSRILVMIGAFKTSTDNEKKKKEADEEEKSNKKNN